jgi:hypothetical protein
MFWFVQALVRIREAWLRLTSRSNARNILPTAVMTAARRRSRR